MLKYLPMTDFSERMRKLYDEMQAAYSDVAGHYDNFSCEGCTDNCCTQRFFMRIRPAPRSSTNQVQAASSQPAGVPT